MGRTFIRQSVQIRNSVTYDDTIAPSLANYETNPTNIEADLNSLRSQCHNLLENMAGNWYDDLNVPSALETGTQRGVNDLNTDLHAVEKKRVLREVWNLSDITPGLDLAITLLNEIKADYNLHIVDTSGAPAIHGVADVANPVASADATDLASAITLANEIKTDYEAHRVLLGGVHGSADGNNPVTAANATDLATLITLANDLRTQYEAHRVDVTGAPAIHGSADAAHAISAPAVGANVQVHILTAAQLPSQTTAAIGVVTTLGTVCATAAAFGTAGLDEVSGSTAISPKNMTPLVDGDTRDPILDSAGKRIYALFQSESAVDGSTLSGTTPNRAQMSFVVITDSGDDLELVDMPTTQEFNYASIERVRLEDLNEQDFLKGATVDVPSSATVTRQVAYDNQGVTAVNLINHATLDLEGPGLVWKIRDDLEADLFAITEGSAGGTSEVAVEAGADTFRVDAVVNDFDNGASFDTGAAGTTINVGVTANQIDAGGVLTVKSGAATDLNLFGQGELLLNDGNFAAEATWAQAGVKVTETQLEITTYEANFGGEVSLFNAINQAYSRSSRVKGYAVVANNRDADLDVDNTTTAVLDQDLPSYASVGSFVDDVDCYLNGELLRNGVDAAANHDFYPGTTPAQGMLRFEFPVLASPGNPDQLCLIVWSS